MHCLSAAHSCIIITTTSIASNRQPPSKNTQALCTHVRTCSYYGGEPTSTFQEKNNVGVDQPQEDNFLLVRRFWVVLTLRRKKGVTFIDQTLAQRGAWQGNGCNFKFTERVLVRSRQAVSEKLNRSDSTSQRLRGRWNR